jgi:hypothetical protein
MLKKPASFVLASLKRLNVPQGYAFASSLAAAALDNLFEHPANSSAIIANILLAEPLPDKDTFFLLRGDLSINARGQ